MVVPFSETRKTRRNCFRKENPSLLGQVESEVSIRPRVETAITHGLDSRGYLMPAL